MASAEILCGICEGQNIKKLAQSWCPECEEGLCSDCLNHHGISKFTKMHQVISVDNFNKLPKNISSIVHHCKDHGKIFTNYCKQHECLCCPVCISGNHKKCVDILAIDDFIQTAKSSALLDFILDNIDSTKKNLNRVLALHDQNISQNKQYRNNILNEIHKIRSGINYHFDQLEKKITEELSDAEEKIKQDVTRISSELRDKKRTIEQLERDTVAIKQYASDLQTCLGTIRFRDKVDEIKNYLISLQAEGKLKTSLIKCDLSDQCIRFETAFKTFGEVSITEIPLDFEIQENKQGAQIMSRPAVTVVKSINDINVNLERRWNVPKGEERCWITGCVITSDGKIIIVDHNPKHRVLLHKEDGGLIKEIMFPSEPTDVTSVDDKTICVSFNNTGLEIINTMTYKTTHVIPTSNFCCGVTSDNGNLIWYEQCKGIQMKQRSNDTITTLVKDDSVNYWSYLTVHNNKIYQTDQRNNTVTCYKMNGEKVWQFKDENAIRCPSGITVDNDSNVYLASSIGKIMILSPDGKSSREILTKANGLYAIYFDKRKNTLLVTNSNGQVFLYSVT